MDDFGYDEKVMEFWAPVMNFFYKYYWRVSTDGIENVPEKGGCLLVANHSGMLPFDAVMIKAALWNRKPHPRNVRILFERFVPQLPFISVLFVRTGNVLACPENTLELLKRGETVLVFPEGVKGIGKPSKKRYILQRFGRSGFVKMALETDVPIIPVAVVGAEEMYTVLFNFKPLAGLFSLPYIPITTTFPWLGPLGLIPKPTKWHISFLSPIKLVEKLKAKINDDYFIANMAEEIRQLIQKRLIEILRKRRSIYFG